MSSPSPVNRFLADLRDRGYFKRRSFEPREVIEAARRTFGIDVLMQGGNDRLSETINGLVREGMITFEYSQDASLHPKDVLDYWRNELTAKGESVLGEGS